MSKPYWFEPVTISLAMTFFVFSVWRFTQGYWNTTTTKNRLTFISLYCMGLYYVCVVFACIITAYDVHVRALEIAIFVMGNLLTSLALTVQMFEFHLIAVMVKF
jgi:hypothetical protein